MGDDGGMDPCECVWGHELAMRRILNILRNSQAVCTDNECFEVGPSNDNPNSQNALLLTVFIMVAFVFYFLRPRAQRITDPTKPTGNNNGSGAPPSPPPTTF